MTSNVDVHPIMEEIRHLAQKRRRQLSAGQLPADLPTSSEEGRGIELLATAYGSHADLLNPTLVPSTGLFGWFARILRQVRRKFLLPFLSRQTDFNQAVIHSFEVLGSRLQSLEERTREELKASLHDMLAQELLELREHWDRSLADLTIRLENLERAQLHTPTILLEEHDILKARLDELRVDFLQLHERWEELAGNLASESVPKGKGDS